MANPNLTVQRWRRRKSECFFQHICMERYTANKVAAFLRGGQKEGGYFVRVGQRCGAASRRVAPWTRNYYWVVRVYRKVALLLLGWYLIWPPWIAPMRFDTQAPLSHWEIAMVFDRAIDCNNERAFLSEYYRTHASTVNFSYPSPRYLTCIASDDPRLAH